MNKLSNRNAVLGTRGFTLLETVTSLAMAAVIAVFVAGFLQPQLKLYYDMDRISQAKTMCSEAYRKLEEKLRYGYMFYCDPSRKGELAYYIREGQRSPWEEDEENIRYEEIPPIEQWPGISAGDLDVREMEGMVLELDFSGTKNTQVHVSIKVKKDEEVVYEQNTLIRSMYSYTIEKENEI